MSQNFPLVKQQTTIDPELVRQALLDLEVIIRKLEIEVGDIKKRKRGKQTIRRRSMGWAGGNCIFPTRSRMQRKRGTAGIRH